MEPTRRAGKSCENGVLGSDFTEYQDKTKNVVTHGLASIAAIFSSIIGICTSLLLFFIGLSWIEIISSGTVVAFLTFLLLMIKSSKL